MSQANVTRTRRVYCTFPFLTLRSCIRTNSYEYTLCNDISVASSEQRNSLTIYINNPLGS